MAKYVTLATWTEQGVKDAKQTVDRAGAAREAAKKFGGRMEQLYWTMGAYDVVGIFDFPDDESASAFAIALAGQGNVRTTTLRAYDEAGMKGVLGKLG